MSEYRIKKWYSKDNESYYYTPQFKDRFLFWYFWRNLTSFGYSEIGKAQYEIDKNIKDLNNGWPEDEIIEYKPKSK